METASEQVADINSEHKQYIRDRHKAIISNPNLTDEEKIDQVTAMYLEVEKRVVQDPLIEQFFNKRGFNQALERQIALNKRHGLDGVLAYLDIDHFKRFNDTLGHPKGDDLIKLYAQKIMDATRESDIWGRVGGDELAVYLVNSNLENAQIIAERIRTSIIEGAQNSFPDLPWEQTVSIGLALWQKDDSPQQLQENADQALLEAKTERNKVVIARNR